MTAMTRQPQDLILGDIDIIKSINHGSDYVSVLHDLFLMQCKTRENTNKYAGLGG